MWWWLPILFFNVDPGGDVRPENRPVPSPTAALDTFILPEGYVINCFASEEDFPELANPTAMAFDSAGRLWVTVSPTYPHVEPGAAPDDKLLILEDTDRDGRADRRTIFARGLHIPTGFALGDGGAYVVSQPHLLHVRDTDGDLVADESEVVLHGFGTEDSHHSMSAFVWRPDGAMYFNEGTFHHTQIETPHGPRRLRNGGVIRYKPDTEEVDVVVSFPFANPWGHIIDQYGQSIISDASNGYNYRLAHLMGPHTYPDDRKTDGIFRGVRSMTPGGRRPSAGGVMLRSRHFPEAVQDRFVTTQCIGFHGLRWYELMPRGSGFETRSLSSELLQSTDTSFRPIDVEIGPDGAMYVLDWANPIVGHMQFNIRDDRRDQRHGRVWRISHSNRPLLTPPDLETASVEDVLPHLRDHEITTRALVRRRLQEGDPERVLPALRTWVRGIDPGDPERERLMLEALWIHQGLNEIEATLLDQVLTAGDPRIRAGGVRVLRWWQDDLPESLAWLERAVLDPSQWVRLEAVLALGHRRDPRAAELVGLAAGQPMDADFEVVFNRSLAALATYGTPTGRGTRAWRLRQMPEADLLAEPLDHFVVRERLRRPALAAERRREAVDWLVARTGTSPATVLLQAAMNSDPDADALDDLIEMLVSRPVEELRQVRPELVETASDPEIAVSLREGSWAAVALVDGAFSETLATVDAGVNPAAARRDLLAGIEWIVGHPAFGRLHEDVWREAVAVIPDPSSSVDAPSARYLRLSLPRPGTITLAEVEVESGGRDVARNATARQSSTAWEGHAERAIDGSTDGVYARGSSTHTREGDPDPFWELDLGETCSIDAVTIWGRSERPYDQRLDDFIVELLDGERRLVWRRDSLPPPQFSLRLEPGRSWDRSLVDAALAAVTALPGRARPAMEILVALAEGSEDESLRQQAIERMQSIPASFWKAEEEQWRIRDVVITTVPDRMVYDVVDFEVEAGRPVRLTLVNPDGMPHNLLLCRPGSMKRVGIAADNLGTGPDAVARNYVPDGTDVLEVLPLVEPGETASVLFLAPDQPGRYPYVCTIPGHWPMMNGVMTVTRR